MAQSKFARVNKMLSTTPKQWKIINFFFPKQRYSLNQNFIKLPTLVVVWGRLFVDMHLFMYYNVVLETTIST